MNSGFGTFTLEFEVFGGVFQPQSCQLIFPSVPKWLEQDLALIRLKKQIYHECPSAYSMPCYTKLKGTCFGVTSVTYLLRPVAEVNSLRMSLWEQLYHL